MEIDLTKVFAYSMDCLQNRDRLRSVIKDIYPKNIRDLNIILTVFDSGIPEEMKNNGYIDMSHQYYLYVKSITNQYGLQESVATEGLDTWIDCFEKLMLVRKINIKTKQSSGNKPHIDGKTLPDLRKSRVTSTGLKKEKGKFILGIFVLLAAVAAFWILVYILQYSDLGKIRLTFDLKDINEMDYQEVVENLESLGFENKNITCVEDYSGGEKPGTVKNIIIDNNNVKKGNLYNKNANIVIRYANYDREDLGSLLYNWEDRYAVSLMQELFDAGYSIVKTEDVTTYNKNRVGKIAKISIGGELFESGNYYISDKSIEILISKYIYDA